MLSVCRRALERAGYVVTKTHVTEEITREEVIKQVVEPDEKKEDTQLLITDMMMTAEMNGLQLLEGVRSIKPLLPTIIMSGYISGETLKARTDALIADPNSRVFFLAKAFTPAELLATVQRALSVTGGTEE